MQISFEQWGEARESLNIQIPWTIDHRRQYECLCCGFVRVPYIRTFSRTNGIIGLAGLHFACLESIKFVQK